MRFGCAALREIKIGFSRCQKSLPLGMVGHAESGGAGGCLDEEAIFEERLEGAQEGGAGLLEFLAEAVFDAFEGELNVGEEQVVELAADDGDEDDMFALAADGVALVGQLEGVAEGAVFVAQLHGQAVDGVGHAFGGAVAGGITTGVGDEGESGGIHEEDFLDLEAVGSFKHDVLVGAAGEERLEVPDKAVHGAGALEWAGSGGILGEGAADGGAEHGFEKFVDATFTAEARVSQGFLEEGVEGFEEVGVGEIGKGNGDGLEGRRAGGE
jgi:hypothetical protein